MKPGELHGKQPKFFIKIIKQQKLKSLDLYLIDPDFIIGRISTLWYGEYRMIYIYEPTEQWLIFILILKLTLLILMMFDFTSRSYQKEGVEIKWIHIWFMVSSVQCELGNLKKTEE